MSERQAGSDAVAAVQAPHHECLRRAHSVVRLFIYRTQAVAISDTYSVLGCAVEKMGPGVNLSNHFGFEISLDLKWLEVRIYASGGHIGMKISEIVKNTGLSESTIRYYEKSQLCDPIARGLDGQRRFSAKDLKCFQVLAVLRETGMPTEEMRTFLALCSPSVMSEAKRKSLLEAHRTRLLAKRKHLDDCLNMLDEKLTKYSI
ncbi:MerR family transcriptional regulator [Pelagibacterium halotolerans]|uniref:MerR family transcriptional regulator n=1 Tax=Pelagibacterium halotolerans TaxID=531813 RepID=UPI00384E2DBA